MTAPAHHRFTQPSRTTDAPRLLAWVAVDTLADLLDVSESTIWEWTRKGILPKPQKLGGSTRWKWAEVETRLDPRSHVPEDPILKASRGR